MARGRTKKGSGGSAALKRFRSLSPVKQGFERRDNRAAAKIIEKYRQFVPALKKYGRRKTYTPGERAFINRIPKILRFTDNLFPVSQKIADEFPDQMYVPHDVHGEPIKNAPQISAIRERYAGKVVKIRKIRNDLLMWTNGRNYLLWRLNKVAVADMKRAGKRAFDDFRNSFPAQKIAELAERAFRTTKARAVYLWTPTGRAGEGFNSLESFLEWLFESYAHYQDTEKWVNGLVIAV